jgi:hypothetical protein
MRVPLRVRVSLLAACLCPAVVAAQQSAPDSVSAAGVFRASAVVDSVFVDRLVPEAVVGSGDWASYLMARLGVVPIPPDLKIAVSSDTARIRIESKLGALPYEARRALGPMFGMFPPETVVAGDISLAKVAREVVRFRLETVRVNGVPLPDPVVQSVMFDVGRQYPALTKSGRDLFVEIPADAEVELRAGTIRLVGPPKG